MPSQGKKPAAASGIRVQERWLQLCHEAAVEGNPNKLIAFVHEMNGLLDEKRSGLKLGRAAVTHLRRVG